jgi:hypothetical protein
LADLADEKSMLLLQTVLTVAYVAVVGRVWLLKRRGSLLPASAVLPIADQAPETAVGLPPAGEEFVTYVDDGIAALGDYLSEGFAT